MLDCFSRHQQKLLREKASFAAAYAKFANVLFFYTKSVYLTVNNLTLSVYVYCMAAF